MRRFWPGLLLGLTLLPGATIGFDPLLHRLGLPDPSAARAAQSQASVEGEFVAAPAQRPDPQLAGDAAVVSGQLAAVAVIDGRAYHVYVGQTPSEPEHWGIALPADTP